MIDPADVRWIWLTHPDRDHTGGLFDLLEAAPLARLVTTFIGAGIMSTEHPLPMDRLYLLNPGQTLDVGDRTLTGFRPPLFDNPATVGLRDNLTGTTFTSDCFGAPLPSAGLASCTDCREIPAEMLRAGQLLWATVDSPWIHDVDPVRFQATVALIRATNPTTLLSTHLPPAVGLNTELFTMLTQAPTADPFIGPDQQALEQMLAGFEPAIT